MYYLRTFCVISIFCLFIVREQRFLSFLLTDKPQALEQSLAHGGHPLKIHRLLNELRINNIFQDLLCAKPYKPQHKANPKHMPLVHVMVHILFTWSLIIILYGITIEVESKWVEFHIQAQSWEELLNNKNSKPALKRMYKTDSKFWEKQKVAQQQLLIIIIFKSYHLSSLYSMPGNVIRVLPMSSHLFSTMISEVKIMIPIS